jgi:RHS repeat-associated protein
MSRFRTSKHRLTIPLRIVAAILIPMQVFVAAPANLRAVIAPSASGPSDKKEKPAAAPADPTKGIKVNRSVPKITPPKRAKFSNEPQDSEFANTRVFSEPLLPVGPKTTTTENKALAKAITAFADAANPEFTEPLTTFLDRFPNTRWRASLLVNLASVYRSTGYWSKALKALEDSWKLLSKETEPKAKQLGDYVLGELAQLNARLGRQERLTALFAEIGERDVRGPATEKLAGAKQGLGLMQHRPQDAFRCGPMAIDRILRATNQSSGGRKEIFESRSASQGMSLVQVRDLAQTLGMNYQMAKRIPGAPVIVPAVVNWKVGHFAALTKADRGKFLSQDPTFTDDFWITAKALDEESSGYYLIPDGELPTGWTPVDATEAQNVWGKGNAGSFTPPVPPCVAPTIKCPDCSGTTDAGMADYNIDAGRVSLSISDTPVGYSPPKGPAVRFTASYQQREVAPVSTPNYSNLGNKWSFNWLSYIVTDPANPSADVTAYGPGGGTLGYSGFNTSTQSYAPQLETQVSLVKTGPTSYEKHFPDGSKQVFALSDGASVYPRKIFMTQSVDPAGNSLTYTYDGSFRLVAVTDALGQVTTISYELTADPLKITKITDPFGRIARFEYNANWQLWKITDSIGLVSQFTYGTGDFINKLTTPYGDTKFYMAEEYGYRSLEIQDPHGARERVEYLSPATAIPTSDPPDTVPSGMFAANNYLQGRNTFYWDKKSMAEAPGDYTKARLTHWLHTGDWNVVSDVPESSKLPLENRVWNEYPGNAGIQVGTSNKPIKVGRVLDDGTTQLYQYEYNSFGKVTKSTDPTGRITAYVYDTSGIDLLEVRQQTGSINELLTSHTYNSQHLPLTATDASGKTTTYTYNAAGQVRTITNAKNEVTTYNYDTNGYLQNVVGALPGAITSFTYDGYGRLRTATDSEGYTIVTDYDAIDGDPAKTLNRVAKITYPDGTYEQTTYDRLDAEWTRDRLGGWSRRFHDALRHVVATQDPLNRFVLYDWCICGSLEGITDPNGNITSWIRDIQGRVTDKFYPDQTSTHYTYENTTSRLKTMTDAIGQSTNYAYLADNNLQQVSYTNAVHATPGVNYIYDTNYSRLLTVTDGTGVTSYTYNPVTSPPSLGAARLQAADGPLDNDTITYSYDELGRVINRSINGGANASSIQFDALGRAQSVTNPLGTFAYVYVNTTGRLDHMDYPNGQKVQYTYFDNLGDQRLKQIKNLDPASSVISQSDYSYTAVGQIASWTQANPSMANPRRYDFGYDAADQLRSANLTDTGTGSAVNQYSYDYDPSGNRTNTQVGSTITSSSANNLNQITDQTSGGKMHFRGTVNEPATVTVGGNAASMDAAGNFDGTVNVSVGSNTVAVIATDPSGNTRTNNYQVNVSSANSSTLLYDLNGNLTNDGSKTYEWDAANRLIAINNGAHRSEFTYNGFSQRTKIVEKDNGSVTDTKQFVWCPGEPQPCEERDGSNTVGKRFYAGGEQISGAAYYYTYDHLGSIRELVDSTNAIQVRYDYDQWGKQTKVSGNLDSEFGYTGHYFHAQSGLNLALFRAYNSITGRWLSRDPMEEQAGMNLYLYVSNDPINRVDVLGLRAWRCRVPLHAIPGGTGQRTGPDIWGNPLYHEYYCVGTIGGGIRCFGQDRAGGAWPWEPGKPSDNTFIPQNCEEIPSGDCFERCLESKGLQPRPWYGLCGPGTNCQEWAERQISECRKQCNKKCDAQ